MDSITESFSIKYEGAENQFCGIISRLRDITGGNPVKNETLVIISPTKSHPEYPLTNLVEYGNLLDKCFWNFACYNPKEEENWLLFDFGEKHQISINAYTIRSGGSSHPKSWIFEGSNDKENWLKIDEVMNCTFLNSPRATHTFHVQDLENKHELKNGFRFIRFVQLDNMSPKAERKFRINLKAIEFFGEYSTI